MVKITQKVINTLEIDERDFETIMTSLNNSAKIAIGVKARENLKVRSHALALEITEGLQDLHGGFSDV